MAKTYAGLTYENRPQATVIEYKVKGAADDTYTKDVPMNAGSYTVRNFPHLRMQIIMQNR